MPCSTPRRPFRLSLMQPMPAMPHSHEQAVAHHPLSRRDLLAHSAAAAGALAVATTSFAQDTRAGEKDRSPAEPFGYCLNTSTIRGQGLGLAAEIELAAKVGYQAVEPWLGELDKFVKDGGSLP